MEKNWLSYYERFYLFSIALFGYGMPLLIIGMVILPGLLDVGIAGFVSNLIAKLALALLIYFGAVYLLTEIIIQKLMH